MNLRAHPRAAVVVGVLALVVLFIVLRGRRASATSLSPTSAVTPQYDPSTGAYIDPTTGAYLYPSTSGSPAALGGFGGSGLTTQAADPSGIDSLTSAVGSLQDELDALASAGYFYPGAQDPFAVGSALSDATQTPAPDSTPAAPPPDKVVGPSAYPINPYSGRPYVPSTTTGVDTAGFPYVAGQPVPRDPFIVPGVSTDAQGNVITQADLNAAAAGAPLVGSGSFVITPAVVAAATRTTKPAVPAPSSPRTFEAAPITSSVARPATPVAIVAAPRPYTPPAVLPQTVTVKGRASGRVVAV